MDMSDDYIIDENGILTKVYISAIKDRTLVIPAGVCAVAPDAFPDSIDSLVDNIEINFVNFMDLLNVCQFLYSVLLSKYDKLSEDAISKNIIINGPLLDFHDQVTISNILNQSKVLNSKCSFKTVEKLLDLESSVQIQNGLITYIPLELAQRGTIKIPKGVNGISSQDNNIIRTIDLIETISIEYESYRDLIDLCHSIAREFGEKVKEKKFLFNGPQLTVSERTSIYSLLGYQSGLEFKNYNDKGLLNLNNNDFVIVDGVIASISNSAIHDGKLKIPRGVNTISGSNLCKLKDDIKYISVEYNNFDDLVRVCYCIIQAFEETITDKKISLIGPCLTNSAINLITRILTSNAVFSQNDIKLIRRNFPNEKTIPNLVIEDGIIKYVSFDVINTNKLTIPKGVRGIERGKLNKSDFQFVNPCYCISSIEVEYSNYEDLVSLCKCLDEEFDGLAIVYKISLKGPQLLRSQTREIIEILKTVGCYTTSVSFEPLEEHELLTVETPEYTILDGVLCEVGTDIEELEVPNETTMIDFLTSQNNKSGKNLKRVNLPNTIKRIESCAFMNLSNLEQINIPISVEYIGSDAFFYTGIREITIPASVKEIGAFMFGSCRKLQKINISYKQFSELKEFIENNRNIINAGFQIDKKNGLFKTVSIVFSGPKLDLSEENYLINTVDNNKVIISFEEKNEDLEESFDKQEKLVEEYVKYGEEVSNLVSKIKLICDNLPDETKKMILNNVNELLTNYDRDKKSLKPKFGKSDSNILELGTPKYIGTLKPELIANLESIVMGLSYAKNQIDFLEELNKCKNLLGQEITELSNDDSIESDIKNIKYLSNYLTASKRNEIIDELSDYLDTTINDISSKIGCVSNTCNLVLTNHLDFKMEFSLYLSKMYDDIYNETKYIMPYKQLLKELCNNSIKYCDGNTISDIISSIKYVINNIHSEKYKNQLNKKIDEIVEKYIFLINNIISNAELLKSKTCEELERELRTDLQEILETIKDFSYMDEYRNNKANKDNIIRQLKNSISIIEANSMVTLTNEIELQPITSFVLEINNDLIENKSLDSDDTIEIRRKIQDLLYNHIELLENINIDTLEDYNEVIRLIMSEIASIDMDIKIYTLNLVEYNKYD